MSRCGKRRGLCTPNPCEGGGTCTEDDNQVQLVVQGYRGTGVHGAQWSQGLQGVQGYRGTGQQIPIKPQKNFDLCYFNKIISSSDQDLDHLAGPRLQKSKKKNIKSMPRKWYVFIVLKFKLAKICT